MRSGFSAGTASDPRQRRRRLPGIVIAIAIVFAFGLAACQPAWSNNANVADEQEFGDPGVADTAQLDYTVTDLVNPALTATMPDQGVVDDVATLTDAGEDAGSAEARSARASGGQVNLTGVDLSLNAGSATASGCRRVDAAVHHHSTAYGLAGGHLNPTNPFRQPLWTAHLIMKWCWDRATHTVHQSGSGDSWWNYYIDTGSVSVVQSYSSPRSGRYQWRSGYATSGILIERSAAICNCVFKYGQIHVYNAWIGVYGHDDGTFTIVKHNRSAP